MLSPVERGTQDFCHACIVISKCVCVCECMCMYCLGQHSKERGAGLLSCLHSGVCLCRVCTNEETETREQNFYHACIVVVVVVCVCMCGVFARMKTQRRGMSVIHTGYVRFEVNNLVRNYTYVAMHTHTHARTHARTHKHTTYLHQA